MCVCMMRALHKIVYILRQCIRTYIRIHTFNACQLYLMPTAFPCACMRGGDECAYTLSRSLVFISAGMLPLSLSLSDF